MRLTLQTAMLLGLFGVSLLMGCRDGDLRGTWDESADGETYLSIDEPNGSCRLHVDGDVWPHPIGTPGWVEPGRRLISCGYEDGYAEFEVDVKRGTTYRFNYWGP